MSEWTKEMRDQEMAYPVKSWPAYILWRLLWWKWFLWDSPIAFEFRDQPAWLRRQKMKIAEARWEENEPRRPWSA